jgi:hypothetical protein
MMVQKYMKHLRKISLKGNSVHFLKGILWGLGLWCLAQLSTLFQLYRGMWGILWKQYIRVDNKMKIWFIFVKLLIIKLHNSLIMLAYAINWSMLINYASQTDADI